MADIIRLPVTWGIITTILMSAGTIGGLIFQVKANSSQIAVIDRRLEKTTLQCHKIDNIEFKLEYLMHKPKGG